MAVSRTDPASAGEEMRAMQKVTNQAPEFFQGVGAALGSLARDHGQPFMAIDIMRMNGITFDDLVTAGVEEFDLYPLRNEWFDGERR